MAQRRDLPCSMCSQLMWRTPSSLPEGQATCHPCRRRRRAEAAPIGPLHGPARPPRSGQHGPRKGRTCTVCGDLYDASYGAQQTCGRTCGLTLWRDNTDAWPSSPVTWANCAWCTATFVARSVRRITCSVACNKARLRHRRPPKAGHAGQTVTTPCTGCQQPMTYTIPGSGRLPSCCRRCIAVRVADSRHVRRARTRGARSEHVDRDYVFDRDRWRCQLCGKPVPRSKAWPHPMSASLDHVIPLARQGTHEHLNVQLAHLICNVRKGARGGGEQLALIG